MLLEIAHKSRPILLLGAACLLLALTLTARANPANKIGMSRYYERFLSKRLDACTTCHLPLATGKTPDSLQNFPHNSFGRRLAELGEKLRKEHARADIATRLRMTASEDSDGDGVDNLSEILLGRLPGDKYDVPTAQERKNLTALRPEFDRFLAAYRWQPFESVHAPAVPKPKDPIWGRNPVDAFLAVTYRKHGLQPVSEAARNVLLRRVTLDLTGLSPTPDEIAAFEADRSPDAYEKVVNRLLASPRYGERWARHWMDVWRYSDWAGWADGNQIRDSKPFIWRWRDWIVESLNDDKGYDRMLQEMLAADELCPEDPSALRATGFLVRNYKLLSREQWLEDTMNHTSRAFLGLTMHCAKCHNHMYDPILQADYYRMRAIFEPHNVRTDRVPGQPDVAKDGLVHAFDADPKAATYLFVRGDERNPDKSRNIEPGVPASLGGVLDIKPITLPAQSVNPDRRDFVIQETLAASEKALAEAEATAAQASGGTPQDAVRPKLRLEIATARHSALLAVFATEKLEESGKKGTEPWTLQARYAVTAQRALAVKEAEGALFDAQAELAAAQEKLKAAPATSAKNVADNLSAAVIAGTAKVKAVEKALTDARAAQGKPVTAAYAPRLQTTYPEQSTGRRLAFAKWLTDASNPLAARVAVNHIWAHHFGQGLVPSTSDFGRNGRPPTHPELLDWLAAKLMSGKWQMKELHRLIVTSRAYRLASRPNAANAKIDPDDVLLWRYPGRRMEAETVRDNILYVAGHLDETRGGPEIDHTLGLTSRRRSLYLRSAAEKQSEFMQVFDGPSVTECYERRQTVMPQQALALANSELTQREAGLLADDITKRVGEDKQRFINEAFLRVLARNPTSAEVSACREFLIGTDKRSRQNLILVLFNHNDFVTIR